MDGRKEGRTDGSITISLRNFVGEGIIRRHIIPLRKRKYKIINVQGEEIHDKIGEVIRSQIVMMKKINYNILYLSDYKTHSFILFLKEGCPF